MNLFKYFPKKKRQDKAIPLWDMPLSTPDPKRYASSAFWKDFQYGEEYASVRDAIKRKTVTLLNRELQEKTQVKDHDARQVYDDFKKLTMTKQGFDKLLYGTRRINELLEYKSEIRFDIVGKQRDVPEIIGEDVHLTYGQQASPSSVRAIIGRDPYLDEILDHYQQVRVGLAHSHGPHRTMHSSMDDTVLKSQLELNPRKRKIFLTSYTAKPVELQAKFLPSLVVNDRTLSRQDKQNDDDYHLVIGVRVPYFTGKGLMVEQTHLNRKMMLSVVEGEAPDRFNEDLMTAQILDRVEVEAGDGRYERLVFPYTRKTRLSPSMLLLPVTAEPDFRQRAIDKRNSYQHHHANDAILRKQMKLGDAMPSPPQVLRKKGNKRALKDRWNRFWKSPWWFI